MTTDKRLKTFIPITMIIYVIVNTKTSVKSFRSNRGRNGLTGGLIIT